MNVREFEKLKKIQKEKEQVLTIDDLTNKEDRTLLYGYTCEKETWHVYVKNNAIYTLVNPYGNNVEYVEIESNQEYVPDKRLYPERCDFEFCSLLKQKGIYLPFTTWQDDIKEETYYGKVIGI
ncbi:hypothetical protein CON36_32320 [Bacillus cereus]|uniref:Uncharacterized protein n=2 Tax=Bacillus cereus group TaxID=86661 RepID=A0A9X6XVK4_BACCE|nr:MULTISPECIES: hypothetical protein [Bacillus cereus group]PDZ94714.1 hypothetical protein CON36_32320 [Bacillus cereus]PFJ27128.1 hypothetical protein COJ15_34425 [Bacillus thuringiensis]